MIKTTEWTPKQIAEDLTIPQIVMIWLDDQADPRRRDPFKPGPGERIVQLSQKEKQRLFDEQKKRREAKSRGQEAK